MADSGSGSSMGMADLGSGSTMGIADPGSGSTMGMAGIHINFWLLALFSLFV